MVLLDLSFLPLGDFVVFWRRIYLPCLAFSSLSADTQIVRNRDKHDFGRKRVGVGGGEGKSCYGPVQI